jgi:hypothetical protein
MEQQNIDEEWCQVDSIGWRTAVKQGYTARSALRQTRSGMELKHTDGYKSGHCKVGSFPESFQYVALQLYCMDALSASTPEFQHVPGHPGLHNPNGYPSYARPVQQHLVTARSDFSSTAHQWS